MQRRLYFEDI